MLHINICLVWNAQGVERPLGRVLKRIGSFDMVQKGCEGPNPHHIRGYLLRGGPQVRQEHIRLRDARRYWAGILEKPPTVRHCGLTRYNFVHSHVWSIIINYGCLYKFVSQMGPDPPTPLLLGDNDGARRFAATGMGRRRKDTFKSSSTITCRGCAERGEN